eukprot:5542878-Ditylum_brightwellii.AAC.1
MLRMSILSVSSILRQQKQYTSHIQNRMKEKKRETAPQAQDNIKQEHIKHFEHIETTETMHIQEKKKNSTTGTVIKIPW